jgi:hypothetical protein
MNREPVRFQPSRDGIDILLGHAVVLGELAGRQPLVKVPRLAVVQLVDVLRQRRLPLGRPFQLQQHVVQWKVLRHNAPVVQGIRFRPGVPLQGGQPRFIDGFADDARRTARRLSVSCGRPTEQPNGDSQATGY